jgi:tRNA (guanine-N7-)-methyltransferase
VNLLAKVLKSGGVVHIATDWDDYAEQIETVFTDWPTCDIPERSSTKYEKRGLKLKHDVHDLAYTKIERDTSQSEGVRWIAY